MRLRHSHIPVQQRSPESAGEALFAPQTLTPPSPQGEGALWARRLRVLTNREPRSLWKGA